MSVCPPNTYQLWYPNLSQWFANALAIAINQLGCVEAGTLIPVETTKQRGLYRSAIALRLDSASRMKHAEELGAIARNYLSNHLGNGYRLTVHTSGWIDMQVSTAQQIACVTKIAASPPRLRLPHDGNDIFFSVENDPELVFELQYAHARCCSLLRLSETIVPESLDLSPFWLDAYFEACQPTGLLEQTLWMNVLNFPAQLQGSRELWPTTTLESDERDQVASLLCPLSEKRMQGLGQSWVKLFQQFYSHSRVIGLTLPDNREQLALRYVLLLALMNILEFILTSLCRTAAPQIL